MAYLNESSYSTKYTAKKVLYGGGEPDENLGWIIPAIVGVISVGGVAFTAWGLVRGEDRRKKAAQFAYDMQRHIVSNIKTGGNPKLLGVCSGFEHTQYNGLMRAASEQGLSVAWTNPTQSKVNVLLVSTKDGNCIVVADNVRSVAEAVTSNEGVTDWEAVRSILSEANAKNARAGGWFSDRAYSIWYTDMLNLQRDISAGIVPPIRGIGSGVKPIPKVTKLDWILIVVGSGVAALLGWHLIKGKNININRLWQRKYISPQTSSAK